MPRMVAVEVLLDGDVTYVVPLQRALDDWISEHGGDAASLPAVQLESGQPSAAMRLRLTWIEVTAESAWDAMTRRSRSWRLAARRSSTALEGCFAKLDRAREQFPPLRHRIHVCHQRGNAAA